MEKFVELADFGTHVESDIEFRIFRVGGSDAYFEVARPYLDPNNPYKIYTYPDDRERISKAILSQDYSTIASCIDPDLLVDGKLTPDQVKELEALTGALANWLSALNS